MPILFAPRREPLRGCGRAIIFPAGRDWRNFLACAAKDAKIQAISNVGLDGMGPNGY
jgi:hypothetical protein